MKGLKRFALILLCMLFVFGSTNVFASPKDDLNAVMEKNIYNAKLKMEFSLDLNEISSELINAIGADVNFKKASVFYDVAMDMSEDYKKLAMAMKVTMNVPNVLEEGNYSFDSYIDMDLSDEANPKMIVITKMPNQDKYIYLDYTKIPGFEDFSKIFEMYSPDKVKEINEAVYNSLKDDSIKFTDNKYIITYNQAELIDAYKSYFNSTAEIYKGIFKQMSGMQGLNELDFDIEDINSQIEKFTSILADKKLFDDDALVYTLSVDSDNNIDVMKIDFNFNFNLYDLVTFIAPEINLPDENLNEFKNVVTKENSNIKATVSITYDFDDINSGVEVSIPEITAENSIDALANQNPINPDEINVFYNNIPVVFDDAKPFEKDDRTLVPLRKFANTLGISDENIFYEDGIITLINGDTTMTLTVDEKNVVIKKGDMQSQIELDVPATVINGRTFVPLRFISENFNCDVDYIPLEESNGSIIMIKSK